MKQEECRLVRGMLAELRLSRQIIEEGLLLPGLRFVDLQLGYDLGLVDAAAAIRIETRRAQLGLPQDRQQRHLSFLLSDEIRGAEDALGSHFDALGVSSESQLLWVSIILRSLLERWRFADSDPTVEAQELAAVAGDLGREIWDFVRPRGLDALVFTRSAAARFIRRVVARSSRLDAQVEKMLRDRN